jgi:hypothetical protein
MDQDKHLSERSIGSVVPSKIGEGVFLADIEPGNRLELETRHHHYSLTRLGGGRIEISGHPDYCPEPTAVDVLGSSRDGMLKSRFVGYGMRLEFRHPLHDLIVTSTIREVVKVA